MHMLSQHYSLPSTTYACHQRSLLNSLTETNCLQTFLWPQCVQIVARLRSGKYGQITALSIATVRPRHITANCMELPSFVHFSQIRPYLSLIASCRLCSWQGAVAAEQCDFLIPFDNGIIVLGICRVVYRHFSLTLSSILAVPNFVKLHPKCASSLLSPSVPSAIRSKLPQDRVSCATQLQVLCQSPRTIW